MLGSQTTLKVVRTHTSPFKNKFMLAHTSAFQNIIYYSFPDVVDRERVGRQGDRVDTYYLCAVGPVA